MLSMNHLLIYMHICYPYPYPWIFICKKIEIVFIRHIESEGNKRKTMNIKLEKIKEMNKIIILFNMSKSLLGNEIIQKRKECSTRTT